MEEIIGVDIGGYRVFWAVFPNLHCFVGTTANYSTAIIPNPKQKDLCHKMNNHRGKGLAYL